MNFKEIKSCVEGYTIYWYDSLTSTNDKGVEFAQKGCINKTVIVADYQTNGRGQRDNLWESEKGANLTFSLLVYPTFLKAHNQFLLSKICGLAVCDYLESIGIKSSIKWPNDIYIDDAKVTGMLIENSLMGEDISFTVAGIGINVNQSKFSENVANPVSIFQKTGKETRLMDVLNGFLFYFHKWYNQLENGNFSEIDERYFKKLYRLNGFYLYEANGRTFKARIYGISTIGELILEEENGEIITYAFKEIGYII